MVSAVGVLTTRSRKLAAEVLRVQKESVRARSNAETLVVVHRGKNTTEGNLQQLWAFVLDILYSVHTWSIG